jgi:hypothetical protein
MSIRLVQILVGFCISFTITLLMQSCKTSHFCCRSTPVSSAPNIEDPDSIFANYDRIVHQRIKGIRRILARQDSMPAEYGITKESLTRTKDSLQEIARGLEQMKHSEVIYYFYYDSNKVEGHGVTEIADNPSMYDSVPNERRDLSSPIGKQLKRNTEKEGAEGVPNAEFYKGWQKDYNKGRRHRSYSCPTRPQGCPF